MNVLVIGATSSIAQAICRRLAERGAVLFLVARDGVRLGQVVEDFETRGAQVLGQSVMDVLDYASHARVIREAVTSLGSVDLALVAHGTLPDQEACERSAELVRRETEVNGLSTVALLTELAQYFEGRSQGQIVVLSSVAGDRGRRSNYVYGAAKALVSTYALGLRNRLHPRGVGVLVVKPGFVDTPMTRGFPKGVLWAQPDRVARDVLKAASKNRAVCYTPWYWRYIMGVVRLLPDVIFKRLSL